MLIDNFIYASKSSQLTLQKDLRLIKLQWKLERFSFARNCGCKIRQLSIIASQQSIKSLSHCLLFSHIHNYCSGIVPSIVRDFQQPAFFIKLFDFLTLTARTVFFNFWKNTGNFVVLVCCAAIGSGQKMVKTKVVW